MRNGTKLILALFVASAVIGVVSGELLFLWMMNFYASQSGAASAYFDAPFLATGISAGVFTISLLMYPLIKKGDRTNEWEDFR